MIRMRLAWWSTISVVFVALPAHSQTVAERFSTAVEEKDAEYEKLRAAVLRGGKPALAFLKREAESGATVARRALAAAMVLRIEDHETAKRLDGFKPDRRINMRRNPHPGSREAIRRAYRAHPALAFERLATRTRLIHWQVAGLSEVVAKSPRDAAGRLAHLTFLYPRVGLELARLSGSRAGETLARALERAGTPEDRILLLHALAASRTRDKKATALARGLFRQPGDEDVQTAAIRALGAMGDKAIVPEFVRSLTLPDATAGMGTRREVTVRALEEILGKDEVERRAGSLASDPDAALRHAAAYLSGWLTRDGSASAERLARLIVDASGAVRLQALDSLSWLCVQLDPEKPPPNMSGRVEAAVLRATRAADKKERGYAEGALWRLVTERMRVPGKAIQLRAVEMALADPEENIRLSVLLHLRTYLEPGSGAAILLMLDDLGRLPRNAGHYSNLENLRKAREATLSRANLAKLAKSDIPMVRDLVRAWARRNQGK